MRLIQRPRAALVTSILLLASCGSGGGNGGGGSVGPGITSLAGLPPSAPLSPLDARILPLGARSDALEATLDIAPGVGRLLVDPPRYTFEFVGDETLRYVIDTSHPDVAGGLLRVHETTTGALPVAEGGFRYRTFDGFERSAVWLRENAVTTLETRVVGETLQLDYADTIGDVTNERRMEFRLVGRSLEVRLHSLDGDLDPNDNYAGIEPGPVMNVPSPEVLRIPYMIAEPVTRFDALDGGKAFVNVQPDWARSSGGRVDMPQLDATVVTNDTTFAGRRIRYLGGIGQQLATPVDETFFITVTRRFEATFPETEAEPSPYRDLLASRTTAVFSRPGVTWDEKREHLAQFQSFGMDHMALYDFWWWSQSTQGSVDQTPTHVWTPAVDEGGCIAMGAEAKAAGTLFGLYTLYDINDSQPFHDPTDAVIRAEGDAQTRIAPARALAQSAREDGTMRDRYQTSISFTDVFGFEHPGTVVDFDPNDTTKGKTIAATLADKRALYRQMQEIHEGPNLSEGSGSLQRLRRQFEILSAGYCDSTQASINGGSQADIQDLQPDDPSAPVNWWVMPDYALRVINRLQANHGNGFYDRFFVDSLTPLRDGLLDQYRIYEITYGHASFFQTTGPIDGTSGLGLNNRLYLHDMAKEYYLCQGLQAEYLRHPIVDIDYLMAGEFRTANEVLLASTNPSGALDDFRDPKIRLRYSNGLEIHLNHGAAPWEGIEVEGELFDLPEDGWIAVNPSSGLLAFSAIPRDAAGVPSGARVDYCRAPGRYEMFDGRGLATAYGGLSHGGQPGGLLVRNDVRGLLLVEQADQSIEVIDQGAPSLQSISVQARPSIVVGDWTRARAMGSYAGGATEEVSHVLGEWISSDPNVARINSAGVVEGVSEGTASLTFRYSGIESAAWPVRVDLD